jgi:hypothetical protein
MTNPKLLLALALLLAVCAASSFGADQPCPSIIGCDLCVHPETGECDACSPARNFIITPDAQKQCQCVDKAWLNKEKTRCEACETVLPLCLDCASSGDRSTVCGSCKEGYFWDGSSCIACSNGHPHCIKCSHDGEICQECDRGTYLDTGVCLSCGTNCNECKNKDKCDICADGSFKNNSTGKCDSCGISHCKTCTKSKSCDGCLSGYFLHKTTLPARTSCLACMANCMTCKDNTTCEACQPTYYYNTGTKKCVSCSTLPHCKDCVAGGKCTGCVSLEWYLKDSQCVSCNQDDNHCLTCSDPSHCLSCVAQFYLDAKGCQPCSSFNEGCLTCLGFEDCTSCVSDTYFLNNHFCNRCNNSLSYCATCKDQTTCTSCEPTFFLDPQGLCQSCRVLPGCIDCTSQGCTQCDSTYYLSDKKCILCAERFLHCGACT